jgi:hypothetical protein
VKSGVRVARSKSKKTRGTGIEDDIFLHLLDAWVGMKMETMSAKKVDAALVKLDDFRNPMGDRFEDAADLAGALEEWDLIAVKPSPIARGIVVDILQLWKAIET